jgi:hypothetical protein
MKLNNFTPKSPKKWCMSSGLLKGKFFQGQNFLSVPFSFLPIVYLELPKVRDKSYTTVGLLDDLFQMDLEVGGTLYVFLH